jgi:hypothetical protein
MMRPEDPSLEVELSQRPLAFAELTGGTDGPAWLVSEVEDLASSPYVVHRLASMGIVLRLWLPTGAAATAALRWSGAPPLSGRIEEWLSRVPEQELSAVCELSVEAAGLLFERLAELRELATRGDSDAARSLTRRILEERDELESLARVLALAARASTVIDTLRAFDSLAVTHWSAFAEVEELVVTEHFRSVAWQEPDAWWAVPAQARLEAFDLATKAAPLRLAAAERREPGTVKSLTLPGGHALEIRVEGDGVLRAFVNAPARRSELSLRWTTEERHEVVLVHFGGDLWEAEVPDSALFGRDFELVDRSA